MTFQYDISKSGRQFFQRRLLSLLFITTPLLVDLLYPNDFIKPGYIYAIAGWFIGNTITDLTRVFVYDLHFDKLSGRIIIHYKSTFGKAEQRSVPFTDARLDVYTRKSKGARRIIRIDLMKGKRELAMLHASKDAFTERDLYQVLKAAEENNIGVTFS
jgi:hypothetical protein